MGVRIKFEAELTDAGWLNATAVKVTVELEDVWAAIKTRTLVDEFNVRLTNEDPVALAEAREIAGEFADDDASILSGDDADTPFSNLTDWDLDTLKAAIAQDDGRRVIDLLRRAL